MPTARAKVTSRCRVVLPREVREQLNIGPGDTLVYQYDEGGVWIEKAPPADPFGTFEEWFSTPDDEAYRDL